MEFRQFGRTGLKVSAIGFGCWEIGGTYGHVDEIQFQRAVHAAIDTGITCFDTAEAHGMGVSEEALVRALAGRRNGVIATKFGVPFLRLPHAPRIGRGMLLLLLPLRAFGHGRTGKFVYRAVAAGTLEDPIAAGVDHSRHLLVAWHIFPTVPGVPLRIELGGDGHAANLQDRRHATLRRPEGREARR